MAEPSTIIRERTFPCVEHFATGQEEKHKVVVSEWPRVCKLVAWRERHETKLTRRDGTPHTEIESKRTTSRKAARQTREVRKEETARLLSSLPFKFQLSRLPQFRFMSATARVEPIVLSAEYSA